MIYFSWESQCEDQKIEQYEEFKHIHSTIMKRSIHERGKLKENILSYK